MGLINRDKSMSEQHEVIHEALPVLGTGITQDIFIAPSALQIKQINCSVQGISGSPTWQFKMDRFIVGTGLTTIATFATILTMAAVGTSGVQQAVLATAGSTLLTMQANDVLTVVTAGSNAATSPGVVSVVVQQLQDIKTFFGTSVM